MFSSRQWSRARGFTLIELLVVVVIIAMMVTIAVLNVNAALGDSPLKDSTRRMHAIVQLATEEAILFNKTLGIKIEENNYSFYEQVREKVEKKDSSSNNAFLPTAGNQNANKSAQEYRDVWKPLDQGEKKKGFFSKVDLPEYHYFDVLKEGQEISLHEDKFGLDELKKEEVKPTLYILSDGEIYPASFEIHLKLDASDAVGEIKVDEEGELVWKVKESDS